MQNYGLMKPSGSRNLKSFGEFENSVTAVLASLLIFSNFGCQFRSEKKDSVLIVAVDAIPQVYCDEGLGQEVVFKSLCEESVRFTHAYTTSTSAQAALASILTGLFPFEHRLRDNSTRSNLSARFETLAERALAEGYRTSLISGGPPIWRTSGLGQGFEMVEDNVTLSQERLFRKFGESVDVFLGWTQQIDSDDPFFAVLYAPDNRFLNQNSNDYLSVEFERLISDLKRTKRWDSTHVVLVGLSGSGVPLYDPLPMSLTNRTTQVPLLVKPARKPRDTPLVWKVDANVSLADLGAGILKLLGGKDPVLPLDEGGELANRKSFQVQSLDPIFLGSTLSFEGHRLIPIESAWAYWRWGWNIRYALLNGENLYIHDKDPLIYNTLVDRDQSLPLHPEDPNFRGPFATFEKKIAELNWKPFEIVNPAAWQLMKRLERDPLLSGGVSVEILKEKDRLPGWMKNWIASALARMSFKNQDWKALESWATNRGFSQLSLYLTRRKSVIKTWMPESLDCGQEQKLPISECQRPIVRKASLWVKYIESKNSATEARNSDPERFRENFFREIEYWWLDRSIHLVNASGGFQWDLRDAFEIEPQYFHFLAKFHRNADVRSQISKYLYQIGDRD